MSEFHNDPLWFGKHFASETENKNRKFWKPNSAVVKTSLRWLSMLSKRFFLREIANGLSDLYKKSHSAKHISQMGP